ncbi:diaminohydroxyphosphoribosylamino-pyrimidine deaminase protein [Rutstroemia sp. NJR-2017a WRK4]|nr:diaminohydroxyphosphoribosylamino-pyrimidine deaminase protein [Rutstroemia sp. NJR-2017a WRK4]
MTSVQSLLDTLGPEIEDAEEESFLLFSQSIPSQNLGFVDSKATELEFTINGQDLTIHQSPTILSSNRDGGTTGAVVWKITPLFAKWISSPQNALFKHHIFNQNSIVLELGCGISGLVALSLSPYIERYILTDQPYVLKLLSQNLSTNASSNNSNTSTKAKARKSKPAISSSPSSSSSSNIKALTLDWETDIPSTSLTQSTSTSSFDIIIACDCIYNDALIPPFVQTCVDLCALRSNSTSSEDSSQGPTLCIVAQQLRAPDVFESWLKSFHKRFRVWRVEGKEIEDCGLGEDSGFVVHVGVLR